MKKSKVICVVVETGDDICVVLRDAMLRGQLVIAEDNPVTSKWISPEDGPLLGLTAERDDLSQCVEMAIQDDMIPQYGKRGQRYMSAGVW